MSVHDVEEEHVSNNPVLEVEGLRKDFGTGDASKTVLADVSFMVQERESVCIVGPSGAGKTTLLRCLAGLYPLTEGRILLSGREVSGPPERMAVVFQDYSRSLMPWLTVQSNVELPLRNERGLSKSDRIERALSALDSVGLRGSAKQYPWQLSGGMQQRVAIARALAYEPSILIMDEPFASVDAQTRSDLEDLTHRVREKYRVTLLTVTHDVEEAAYLADRVVVLRGKPATLNQIVPIDIPYPRDQITTKSLPEFAHVRAHILQAIRAKDGEVARFEPYARS